MYFITKEEDLWDKKVVFTHMAEFAEAITIVTSDGGIQVVSQQWEDEDRSRIWVYNEAKARSYILNHNYLREQLHKKGVITNQEMAEYEERIKNDREDYLKRQKELNEQKDKAEYERLKKKFEPNL
jgi:flagellar motility protein MotE (MotC chaperone)